MYTMLFSTVCGTQRLTILMKERELVRSAQLETGSPSVTGTLDHCFELVWLVGVAC